MSLVTKVRALTSGLAVLCFFLVGCTEVSEPDPPAGPHFRTTVLDLVTGEPIHEAAIQEAGIGMTDNLIVTDREGKGTLVALGTSATLDFRVSHPDYVPTSAIIAQMVLARYNSANQPFVTYMIRPADYGTAIPSDALLEEASPHIVYLHRSDFTGATEVTFSPPVPTTPSVARDTDGRFVESNSPGEDGVLLFPNFSGGTAFTSCLGAFDLIGTLPGFSASTYYLCE